MSTVDESRATLSGLRLEIEEFLFAECELIDAWRLDEWIELFSPFGRWLVPGPTLPDGDPNETLYLIDDDTFILHHRVNGLLGRTAHAERPKSRVRHLVGNVRVRPAEHEQISVRANFVVHRTRASITHAYVGEYQHLLERGGPLGFLFVERRSVLDHEALQPQSSISFIL